MLLLADLSFVWLGGWCVPELTKDRLMKKYLLVAGAAAIVASATPSQAALPVGTVAPAFSADATLGGKQFRFSLDEALAKGPVVLYFFPAAFTRGCSVEAHLFAEATEDFRKLGATVIGVSTDPIDKLKTFSVSACQSKFPVASVSTKLLSVYRVKLPILKRATRTSYVIAPDSKVVFEYAAISPSQHVVRTLAALRGWAKSSSPR